MSKRRNDRDDLGIVEVRSSKDNPNRQILIPVVDTEINYRYCSWIRNGKISGEVFARNPQRRIELGLPVYSFGEEL